MSKFDRLRLETCPEWETLVLRLKRVLVDLRLDNAERETSMDKIMLNRGRIVQILEILRMPKALEGEDGREQTGLRVRTTGFGSRGDRPGAEEMDELGTTLPDAS